MELHEVIGRRHMTRSFTARAPDGSLVGRLLTDALGSPTAGNAGGTAWLVLEGPAETAAYWEATTTKEWRASSARWAGLSRAPVIALSVTSPAIYVDRYGEDDKVSSGLGPPAGGGGAGAWAVPYWFGDAAFAVMTTLLAATDAGLGACFLGNFRGEEALLGALSVPPTWRLFGAVLLGYPDGADHRSASLDRKGPPIETRLHRGGW